MPQVRGKTLVRAACAAVLASCYLPVAPATSIGDEAYTPWLPLPAEHHGALSPQPARPQAAVEEDAASTRMKRVFLSRGWGPGGYDAPAPQPPLRYVRRPPLPQSADAADMERPFASPLSLKGKAVKYWYGQSLQQDALKRRKSFFSCQGARR